MFIKRMIGFIPIALLLIIGLSSRFGSPASHVSAAAPHFPLQAHASSQAASYPQSLDYSPAIASPTPACGPAWNVISTTNLLTQTNEFLGISAADANHVWAVGDYQTGELIMPIVRTLIHQWDGYQWSVVSSPNVGAGPNTLHAVAAATISDVWAVGEYSSTTAYQTLTEHWDSASWQVITSANASAADNQLFSVTSLGSNRWAVGGYKTTGDYLTLAETWNGSSWQVVPSDNVGSADNVLLGVSASMSDTWAVGYWNNIGSSQRTLIERWDGSAWHTVSSPNIGSGDNVLKGVVATSDGNAWAVGFYHDTPGATAAPLILRWDGTSWQTVSNPSLGVAALLTSVAASAPNDIWAVGEGAYGLNRSSPDALKHLSPSNVTTFDTLIEHWNGTSWSIVPSPSRGDDSNLDAVTTVSNNDAWAAGHYVVNTIGYTLAERYTGTCPPSPTPTPTPPVTATPTDCPNPFVDINGNVFYFAIHYLNCRSVINGTDPTHYSPAGTSTRGQFAKVVVLGFGTPFYTPMGGQTFVDVPPSYFAYLYIETGFHAGILNGFDPNTCAAHGLGTPCYLPNIPITRGQLTKLVVNAGNYALFTPTGGGQDFTDVPPSNIFYVSIETAYHNNVVGGYPDHTFRPNNNIRRDEMAQIVYKGVVNRP